MRKFYMITLIMTLLSGILLPAAVSAAQPVSWTTESYRAYAYANNVGGTDPHSDEAFGLPLPVSADIYWSSQAHSYIDSAYMTVFAYSGSTSEMSEAITEFTGTFTASNPGFIFSYTFTGSDIGEGWITITDSNSSTVLFDTNTSYGTDTISVNTPIGHDIEVYFGIRAEAYPLHGTEDARLNYAMGVAPEPASMILFSTGGVVLALRRKLKKSSAGNLVIPVIC